MKKQTLIATLTLGALLIGSTAFAWPGGKGARDCDGPRSDRGFGMMQDDRQQDRMDRHHDFMKVALELTDEQDAQLTELRDKHQAERLALRTKMRASREALRELAQSDKFDEATFRTKARESADLQTEMHADRVRHQQEVLAILTPEQQAKAEQLRDLRDDRRRDKRGGCNDCRHDGRRGGRGDGHGPGMGYGMPY